MKFFIDNQEIDQQVENVIKKVRLHMNGETTHQMKLGGIHYRTNYGVGLPHLKKIAAELPNDYKLAERLWYREIRETMILAAMIVPQNAMTAEKCNEWAKLIANMDLIERSTPSLFGKLNIAPQLAQRWLNSTNEWLIHLACHTLGWYIQHTQKASATDLNNFLNSINNCTEQELNLYRKSFSFTIRKYVRVLRGGTSDLNAFLHQLKKTENTQLLIIREEIITELEFVSEQ